jgi:hypothetical protein
MARFAPNAFYSGAFNTIKNGANRRLVVMDSEQATYANVAAATLAEVAIEDTDMTEGAGSVSGRKLTIAQQSDISITDNGDATHVALVDDDADVVLYITTCTTQALTSGGTVTVPAWDIEIRAPAAP